MRSFVKRLVFTALGGSLVLMWGAHHLAAQRGLPITMTRLYTGPDGPVRCAMELSQALKNDVKLQLRMGIHSGPVRDVADVAGHTNLAGRV